MTYSIRWMGYPASYTPGRNRPVQYVTNHYTAGSEGPSSAEAGIDYDKRRTDGTSCHFFIDSEPVALQEVPVGDRSHSARQHGNEIGIHIEWCGTRQSRAQWLDPVSYATMQLGAWLNAKLLRENKLACQRLTVAQTRAAYYAPVGQRPTGFNDHNAVTLAYPEDQGDHTDMGPEFPWDVFVPMVEQFYRGRAVEMGLGRAQVKNLDGSLGVRLVGDGRVSWPFVGNDEQWAGVGLAFGGQVINYGTAAADYYYPIIGFPAETEPVPGLVPHTHLVGESGPAVPQ